MRWNFVGWLFVMAQVLSGCAVISVVDTAVSVTATVVETTVDVAAGAVDAVAGSSKEEDLPECDEKSGSSQRNLPDEDSKSKDCKEKSSDE